MRTTPQRRLTELNSKVSSLRVEIDQWRDLTDKVAPLKPPIVFSLEMALEYIEDDELVEITPKAIRMRKLLLKEADRKKDARQRV